MIFVTVAELSQAAVFVYALRCLGRPSRDHNDLTRPSHRLEDTMIKLADLEFELDDVDMAKIAGGIQAVNSPTTGAATDPSIADLTRHKAWLCSNFGISI